MSVELGVTLPQFTSDPERFVSGATRAVRAGLDSVWVFDHLWPLSGGKQRPMLEAWTSLAYLAAATDEVTIGTLVTRSSLRRPPVLAKMVATVAAIAPGRLTVAIGSGDAANRGENEAFGLPYYAGQERLRQFEQTVDLIRHFLHEAIVTVEGKHARIRDLPTSPRPDPIPTVWMAGRSPEVLELAGRTADGWNSWASTPEEFAAEAARVRAAAGDRAIELTWAGPVIVAATERAARSALGERNPDDYLVGSPAMVAEGLTHYVAAGATHLIVTLPDAGEPGGYELLGAEVAPAMRRVT